MRNKLIFGLTAAAFSFAASGLAFAADMAVKARPAPIPAPFAPFSWTGVYVGINGGVDWENTKTDYSYSSIPSPNPPGFETLFGPGGPLNVGGTSAVNSAIVSGFLPVSLGSHSTAVGLVGAQLGYNYQFQQYVVGIETDLDWVDGLKTTTFTAPPNGFITNNDTQTAGLRWLGTVRARLGYAIDRNLFFVTGGLAYGETKASTLGTGFDGFGTDTFIGNASGWRAGYAVGGGYEYAFTNNVTGKIEYLYYNLGTANYAVAAANAFTAGEGLFINASQKFDGNVLRVGLNWKY
jgi:outer membrane immunogenic protein